MSHNRTPKDPYAQAEHGIDGPARYAVAITNDTAPDVAPRSLYIGGSGNVFCRPMGGANNTVASYQSPGGEHANAFFYNVVGGTILPLRVDMVWTRNHADVSQNTTAVEIVGLY
jgi:hypothetical protein